MTSAKEYVKLEYRLPNGQAAKFLNEAKTYLGNQLECEYGGDRCFGVVADMDAKIARGEMVRFMAENSIENPEDISIENPEDIKNFDRLGYSFRSDLSSDTEYVFERKIEQ